jgi:hypothetical protein
MAEMKRLIKEEREENEKKLDKIFQDNNIKFEGSGPQQYDPTTGGTHHRIEELDEDYDPYNQLGFGF